MALSIFDTSNKVPGSYIDVVFGVGARSAGDAARKVLLFGNMTSSGSATVAVSVFVASEADAISLFGPGSELHQMCRAAFTANPGVSLYAIPVVESAGTAASGTILVNGSATTAGTIQVEIHGEQIEVAVTALDAATAIATALATAITNKTNWPVTASSGGTATCTLTHKQKGPRGNHTSFRARISVSIGTTLTVSGSGFLASGATSDDPQTALDNVAVGDHTYLVAPYPDSTNLTKFKTHVNTAADPIVGIRKQVIAASTDTLGNSTTVAQAENAVRMQIGWHYNADQSPAMVAAALAAIRAKEEGTDPAVNLSGVAVPGLTVQYSEPDRPLPSEMKTALDVGLTPIVNGTICRSITSHSLDLATHPDYSTLDTKKCTVPDFIANDLEVKFASEFARFKLAPDSADATEGPNPGVATPKTVRDWILPVLKEHERNGLIVDVDRWEPQLVTEMATAPAGRINSSIPCDVIEDFDQFAAQVRQIG